MAPWCLVHQIPHSNPRREASPVHSPRRSDRRRSSHWRHDGARLSLQNRCSAHRECASAKPNLTARPDLNCKLPREGLQVGRRKHTIFDKPDSHNSQIACVLAGHIHKGLRWVGCQWMWARLRADLAADNLGEEDLRNLSTHSMHIARNCSRWATHHGTSQTARWSSTLASRPRKA